MSISIEKHSAYMLSHFVLQAALEKKRNPETFSDNFGFPTTIVDSLGFWLETVDNQFEHEPETMDFLKEDLILELQSGSYLDHGADNFLKTLANFLGEGYEVVKFYQLVVECIPEALQKGSEEE